MNKPLLLVCMLGICMSASAQKIFDLMQEPNANYAEVQKFASKYFEKVGTGKGTGYKLFKRWEYLNESNLDENGNIISPTTVIQERQAFRARYAARYEQLPNTTEGNWVELGPRSWTRTSSWSPGQGRITALAVEPVQQNLIYAGSPGGGLWRSTDAGQSWEPLSDDWSNLSIWSIAIDPVDPDIAYAGNSARQILKTTDGGNNWSQVGGTVGSTPKHILINPSNTQQILVATSGGIYRSTNGGNSWTEVENTKAEDLAYMPGSTSTVYACGDVFMRSTDGGATWSTYGTGFVDNERMKLEVTPAAPNNVYLIQKEGSEFGRVYRSTNGGANFTVMVDNTSSQSALDGVLTQANRDMAIAVNDSDPSQVHIGGMNYSRSSDGGSNFSLMARWSSPNDPSYVHADIEVMEYVNGNLYVGSDGGIYRSTDDGDNMEDLTVNGLSVMQLYRIGISQNDPYTLVGGAQDNGTIAMKTVDQDIISWLGADGMECFVDYSNSNTLYGTSQYGTLYKSTNGGNSRSNLSKPGDGDGRWVTPFEIDPQNPDYIYVAYEDLYRHNTGGTGTGSWTNLTSSITGSIGGEIYELDIAPSNNDIIYISRGSNIWKTTNGQNSNPTWTQLSGTSGTISYISIHPSDPQRVAVTTSGSNKIWVTTNGGTSWTNYTSGLPSIGSKTCVWDDEPNHGLYIGMQQGVYFRNDDTGGWVPFDEGLPNADVRELEYNRAEKQVIVCTYGRGIWQSGAYGVVVDGVSANFTVDGNSGCTGVDFTFEDNSSSTGDPVNSWSWDFGAGADPATATGAGPHTVTYATGGTKTVELTVSNGVNNDTETKTNLLTISACGPFNGTPLLIPGTIEAEEYDIGPNGAAYYDDGAGNSGGEFRTDDVDIESCTDVTGGDFNVGWINTGEWLDFTVDIDEATYYDFEFRVASSPGGGGVSISIDGGEVISTQTIAATGGWQSWVSLNVDAVALPEGEHMLRVNMDAGSFNLNKIVITKAQVDCHGDVDGTAYYDSCGTCVGGNTNEVACTEDCEGTWGGNVLEGASCDDGDPCTINDVIGSDCQCAGTLTVPQITMLTVDEICDQPGSISFTFPDEPTRTNIEFSIDGGGTYGVNVLDNIGSTTLEGIEAGTYDVMTRWGNDQCPTVVGQAVIAEDPEPSVIVSTIPEACEGDDGQIVFEFGDVASRSNIEFSMDGGATYPLDVADNSGSASFTGLAPGSYSVAVRWGNEECPVDLGTVDVQDDPAPAVTDVIATPEYCEDGNGSIEIFYNAGNENLEFSNDGGANYSLTQQGVTNSRMFEGLAPGVYDIYVRWEDGSCETPVGAYEVLAHLNPVASAQVGDQTCGEADGQIVFTFQDDPSQSNIAFGTDGSTFPHVVAVDAGTLTVSPVAPGVYTLKAQWENGDCPVDLGTEEVVRVSGNPCDDGDQCTINDHYNDTCGCVGDMNPDCILGTVESLENSFELYPNPTNGEADIFLVKGPCPEGVILTDVHGKGHVVPVTGCHIDLSAMPRGVYMLSFEHEGLRYQEKVVLK